MRREQRLKMAEKHWLLQCLGCPLEQDCKEVEEQVAPRWEAH